jgi:hypothetical protein
MRDNLKDTIAQAIEIKELNNLPFVTIWKTGELYGFNFDKKPIGYSTEEFGVKRTVIGIY